MLYLPAADVAVQAFLPFLVFFDCFCVFVNTFVSHCLRGFVA
jgi:hypothetical protein